MKLRLVKLQKIDWKAIKLKKNQLKDWKDVKNILYFQNLLYMLKIIYFKVISCYHNNLLAGYFLIKKTKKLVTKKYFKSIFY